MKWFWNRKPKVVIEYRQPTEVERLELERKLRISERLIRMRKAKDARIQERIRAIEATIAPQLQEIQSLRSKLSNSGQFYAWAQAQQPFMQYPGAGALTGLMAPLAGLGMHR